MFDCIGFVRPATRRSHAEHQFTGRRVLTGLKVGNLHCRLGLGSDGETVFIGGLIKHSTSQNYKRLPVLGRIPGVKMLFSSREETRADAETIVLITPHIVDDLAEDWNTEPVRRCQK